MRKSLLPVGLASVVAAACVTINVYFPEAAAERAADRFIQEVIAPGEQELGTPQEGFEEPTGWRFDPLDFFFPAAHAQNANIDISTPAIRQIQSRMQQRFQSTLRKYFDSGAIGFGSDALIKIRDLSAVPLPERNALQRAVSEENQDRRAVYREIAVANGHPEWEQEIRNTFADRWVANARSGWWYQTGGQWRQK